MYMERGSETFGGETYTEPPTFKLLGLFYLNIDSKILISRGFLKHFVVKNYRDKKATFRPFNGHYQAK